MAKDRHGKKKRSPAEKTRDRQKMTSFNRPLTVTVTRHAYFLLRACRGPGAKAAHAAVGAVSCPFWLQWPGRLFSSSKLEIKSWRGSWSALDSWPLISHSLPLSLSLIGSLSMIPQPRPLPLQVGLLDLELRT